MRGSGKVEEEEGEGTVNREGDDRCGHELRGSVGRWKKGERTGGEVVKKREISSRETGREEERREDGN